MNLTKVILRGPQPPEVNQEAKPVRLIEHPAIRALEDKILLQAPLHGPLPYTLNEPILDASIAVFGISQDDTHFAFPADYDSLGEDSADRKKIDKAYWVHEDSFEIGEEFTDDEIVEALLSLGVDLRDERGLPLRSTKLLFRQAEAAAKGIAGRLPDHAELKLSKWEKNLRQAAKTHLASKKRGSIG
jgi:hypothetical protein